ncbi:hypothetical protein QN277_006368 [Acacia crassicarpa]|uniref:Epidermal patterning factor-like protein n=2 Tax=Acacia crassicarpa TaxID=499986 RepID=A0AAE1ISL8_9FABA|nr:hypothetical protein QN277_006368 [Acacia crassicarpa]
MVMASINSYQYLVTIATLLVIVMHHLFCPVFCFNRPQPSISRRDLLLEEKTRLGSIPPSCHNKCNACHPCMAVQVPTLPSHQRLKPGLTPTAPLSFSGPSYQVNNRYSNYKPLGWKCHCGGHFFNP